MLDRGNVAHPPWRLEKYEALGNDYLLVELDPLPAAERARLLAAVGRLCDRHLGVGGDGLLAFDAGSMSLTVVNPDGSVAEKSGNGLRIAACHAVLRHGAPATFAIATADRANQVLVLDRSGARVTSEVSMGKARFGSAQAIRLETAKGTVECLAVDVGNPHCVVFGEPVDEERCLALGPLIENHPAFQPRRTNVQLVEAVDRGRIRIEIWERGAGRTLASGSSATAAAAAAIYLGLAVAPLTVEMPGGSLEIRRTASGEMFQAGPATHLFTALVDPLTFS